MKKTQTCLTPLLLLAFCLPIAIFAQPQHKFGKVTDKEMALTAPLNDTAAAAYVLYHKSSIFFETEGQPTIVQDIEKRIKLLKRSAFDEADITLYFSDRIETITEVKAAIHLPSGEVIKLKKRDFIYSDHTDGLKTLRFTFPQVTEGAIIEYKYRRRDEALATLPKFYFQETYPVRWAEYIADIPEYYNYISLSGANFNWAIRNDEIVNRTTPEGEPLRVRRLHYATKNYPAIKEEPYSNNLESYLPQTYFQLVSVTYPNVREQFYITSWISLARALEDDLMFGRKFNNKSDISKPLEVITPLLSPTMSEKEKAVVAYQTIGAHMNWNDSYRILTDDRLNICWDKAAGSSAEINMILLGVLNQLGITAKPLLVSLRDRGMHIHSYPIFEQFDHLMVLATLDGKEVVLDVGDPSRSPGLPRFDALNTSGWVADPVAPRWISITPAKTSRTIMATITLQEDGAATAKLRSRMQGYFAHEGKKGEKSMDNTSGPLLDMIVAAHPDAELGKRAVAEAVSPYKPFEMEVDVSLPLAVVNDDFMYVNPVVVPAITESLSATEKRIQPIDFGFGWTSRYIATLKPPAGYSIDELPESQVVSSEDGAVSIKYAAAAENDEIRITYTFNMGKAVFPPEDYMSLKALYDKALELQEALIVLKRIE